MIKPNPTDHLILPGVLETDPKKITERIQIIRQFSHTIHLDLIDGKFAETKTFLDPSFFAQFTKDLFIELHMMVDNPLQYLKPWADVGIGRFIGHVELMPDIPEFIAQGQLLGEVGLALDEQTPSSVLSFPLEDIDCITIMTIKAGKSGQPFKEALLEKVREIRQKSAFVPIEVDGGVNKETIQKAKDAGANRFVATSALFSAPNPHEQYAHLCSLIA